MGRNHDVYGRLAAFRNQLFLGDEAKSETFYENQATDKRDVLTASKPSRAESAWLTASEAGQYLRVEPRTLLVWARQGKVKGYVLSGTKRVTWRFRIEDLDATMSPPSVALENGRIQ